METAIRAVLVSISICFVRMLLHLEILLKRCRKTAILVKLTVKVQGHNSIFRRNYLLSNTLHDHFREF